MARRGVVVIGELNADLIATGLSTPPATDQEILASDFQIVLGSASAIFACGVARLGHPVTFISKTGTDSFGRFCLEALAKAGIAADLVRRDPAARTGVTISLSTRQDRALVTYLGAIAELSYEQVPIAALAGHRHLHMTSYFLQKSLQPSFPRILKQARESRLTTSFDPNSDPSQTWKDEIWEVIGNTDILFLNKSEALRLAQRKNTRAALKHLGQFAPCVVIKLGPQGAMGIRGTEIASVPGFKVKPVDTTGAGDSFAAGFISGYLEGKTLPECLEIGNACGALSTLKAGGTAGQLDRATLRKFLAAHKFRNSHRSFAEP